ncbi:hypothetical protein BC834DRAFT_973948 [Gloeopeniophorella convolvens]|nr:hypothetical protein BC834DRAFT_973948 [Gloeopeniophorella convolvens]
MQERDRAPSRSSLPPRLHRHLQSAPQSSRSASVTEAHTPALELTDEDSTRSLMDYPFPLPSTSAFQLRPVGTPLPYPTSLERGPLLPPLRREASPEAYEPLGGIPTRHRGNLFAEDRSVVGPSSIPHGSTTWPGGQRPTTDPAFYTYPPPPNTARESVGGPDIQQAEPSEWQFGPSQAEGSGRDERFPPAPRIGRAESYTRADDLGWGGSYALPRRVHPERHLPEPLDWRQTPLDQVESFSRTSAESILCPGAFVTYVRAGYSFTPQFLRPHRALPTEPSSSRFSYDTYTTAPERPVTRLHGRPNAIAESSAPTEPAYDQAFIPTTYHQLPGFTSPHDFVSPLLGSTLLDIPGPPTTVDGSSSEAGQGDVAEDDPRTSARKGKRRASGPLEDEKKRPTKRPIRKPKKKTEIACNFCRGTWAPPSDALAEGSGADPGSSPTGSRSGGGPPGFPEGAFIFGVPRELPQLQAPAVMDSFEPSPAGADADQQHRGGPGRDKDRRLVDRDKEGEDDRRRRYS